MSMQYDMKHPIPTPPMIWENAGFWEGVREHKLVFQRCKECGTWIHPPRPMCPKCHSLEKEWAPSSGKGTVFSWVTYRESPDPAFRTPYSVVLVELAEGMRLISNMVDINPEQIFIGMPVEVVFDDIAEGLTLPKFRKVD
jgi:uncharacterized OB-fold protein